MPKMTPRRFARLNKHLKNAQRFRGVGIGSCITSLLKALCGAISGVEAAGVLTISAVLGLLSALLDIKSKAARPLNPCFLTLRRLRR